MKRLPVLIAALLSPAHAEPLLTTWFTQNSGRYARIYKTNAAQNAGAPVTTWSGGDGTQSLPVYADISEILHSPDWLYIRTSNLASYTMGPWYLDAADTRLFRNFPANQAQVFRIPRNPEIPSTKTATSAGPIAKLVNGVSLFDASDTFSYDTSAGQDQTPERAPGVIGDRIWNRNAIVTEGLTLDPTLAHQAGSDYHNHSHPIALRYQLGDHIDYHPATNTYTESGGSPERHSPVVGWARDGFPVYGPYGFSDALDAGSGVRRMISGYTLRDGAHGTTAITVRQILPAWAQRFQNRVTLTAAQYGPAVSAAYPLGHYMEDFDYRGDLGQTQGVGFDLDEHNVRFCVTPEFPEGTWAYFTTINEDGSPAFPFAVGRQYFGNPTGGLTTAAVMNADTPLTREFLGGPNLPITVTEATATGETITLVWNAVEGGSYSVDASIDGAGWTPKAAGLSASGDSRSLTYTALAGSGAEHARITRTALASHDTAGFTTAVISQSVIESIFHSWTYRLWLAHHQLTGDDSLAEADPDHDGVPNTIEWVTGGNPRSSDAAAILPRIEHSEHAMTLIFSRDDDAAAEEGFSLFVEYSDDLETWTTVPIGASSEISDGVSIDIAGNGGDPDKITVEIPTSTSPARFARIRVAIE